MLTALVCWVLAALLGAWYAGDHQAGAFDAAVARGIDSVVGEQSMVARVLSGPTHPLVVYPVIALTIGVAVFRRWWAGAVLAVAAPGVCVLLTELLLKPLFGRVHEGVYSYPSGHTVSAVAALAVAGLVISVDWPVRWRLVLGGLFLLAYVVLAVGLVGMDYHYFTDTVGGFLVAVGVTLPLTVLADRFAARPRTTARGTARASATSR
jgi:membrane-associated phospholipid phosphatase